MKIDPNIFREYDIRGDVRTQLTPDAALLIGRALAAAHFPTSSTLVVGRDARAHSPELAENLVRGLNLQGVHVIDIGMVTTPMLYYALHVLQSDGGVMITGSHNPVHDNGLKICRGTSSFLKDDIRAIYRKTLETLSPASVEGRMESRDIARDYLNEILSRVRPEHRLKIVVDAGNGAAGPFLPGLFEHYATELNAIYCEPDGTFPNHHPDPSVEKNLVDLQNKVLETHADVGLAFDGDGDRIGVVDRDGYMIPADMLLVILAREVLKNKPGAPIIGDVKCSKFTFDDIRNKGGIPVMSQTGHALIKSKIRETNAALAGEMSGHFFFGDRWFGFDDAIYTGARICEILAQYPGSSLRSFIDDLPKSFATPELRTHCPDDVKFDLALQMCRHYSKKFPTNDLDGARIDFPNGWALIRASNTQPALVIRVEADSEDAQNEILRDLAENIRRYAHSENIELDLTPLAMT